MGYLAASRAMLNQHIMANSQPSQSTGNTVNIEHEREELKCALLSAQDSAVVQVLLEVCLLTPEETQVSGISSKV